MASAPTPTSPTRATAIFTCAARATLVAGALLLAAGAGVPASAHGPDRHGPDRHGPDRHGPDRHGHLATGTVAASDCRTYRDAVACRVLRCEMRAPRRGRHGRHRGAGPSTGLARHCVPTGEKKVYIRYRVPETGEIFVSEPPARRRARPNLPVVRRHRGRH